MPKGFFTQGAAVLLNAAVSLDDVNAVLRTRQYRRVGEPASSVWLGGEGLAAPLTSHASGSVLVDVVPEPWPDDMGDPQKKPELFAAWSMGHLGPYAFPNGLWHALQQPSAIGDEEKKTVEAHRAFIRVRFTYVIGLPDNAPVIPEPYDPKAELDELSGLLLELLALPQAICAFNPNGQTLHTRASLEESIAFARDNELPPLEIFSAVRLLRPDTPGWLMMDTVGMWQVDVADHEACFPESGYDLSEVANFLRNASAYVLDKGDVIKSGDTMNGPGDVNWRGFKVEDSLVSPPRSVYRWVPLDGSTAPEALVPPEVRPAPKKKGLFGWLKS